MSTLGYSGLLFCMYALPLCLYAQKNEDKDHKWVAPDRFEERKFGASVAISGDYAVVGSTSGAAKVPGAAYLYKRDKKEGWQFLKKLVINDDTLRNQFGVSVAIDGEYIIIGADQEERDSFGKNPLGASGAAYIFKKDHGGVDQWGLIKKITASDRSLFAYFGRSVSISKNHIVVGAYRESSDAMDQNPLSNAGAVYVFEKDFEGADQWGLVKKITPSQRYKDAFFGNSVSIFNNHIAVGASKSGKDICGEVYLFEQHLGGINQWQELKRLAASDKGSVDYFGKSVSINGDYLLVGAFWDDEDEQGENHLNAAGSAYLFYKDAGGLNQWSQVAKLVAWDREPGDLFGTSVAIFEDYVIVGAPEEDQDEASGNFKSDAGSVYLFHIRKHGLLIKQKEKWNAFDRNAFANFGKAVSIGKHYILAGTPHEGTSERGKDFKNNAGAVYILERH